MSREIKRVPLDFDHDGIWPGYRRECDNDECDGCEECTQQDPPEGDGWQMWETVSEGSPVSPVFASAEELAQWIAAGGKHDCSIEAARQFVEDGYAPSMIGTGFGIFKGYQLAGGIAAHLEHLEHKAGNEFHTSDTRVRHLTHDIAGTVEHIIPTHCIQGTSDRYYLVRWDCGLPNLLEEGDDPSASMTSACRVDGFEVLDGGAA